MMKSFPIPLSVPGAAASFEQVERANDIRLDEIAGAGNRSIDMRLGCQMKDIRNGMALENIEKGRFVAEVDFLERVFGMLLDRSEILEMAGVGQAIEIHELLNFRAVDEVLNEVRPDKSRAAG